MYRSDVLITRDARTRRVTTHDTVQNNMWTARETTRTTARLRARHARNDARTTRGDLTPNDTT
jgi:hypothetical protein